MCAVALLGRSGGGGGNHKGVSLRTHNHTYLLKIFEVPLDLRRYILRPFTKILNTLPPLAASLQHPPAPVHKFFTQLLRLGEGKHGEHIGDVLGSFIGLHGDSIGTARTLFTHDDGVLSLRALI
jgi:hypothetical protein